MKKLRILVADDHEVVREGLKALFKTQPGWQVVGEAATGNEAVRMAGQLRPDIVVMDFTMPELNGLEATRRIRKDSPCTEVLILTMHDSERLAHQSLAAGARGYLLKSDGNTRIIAALKTLAQHQPYLTPRVSAMVLEGFLNPGRAAGEGRLEHRLSPRESEITQLIAEGLTSKEIGARLSISQKTVEAHRGNIMRKLNLRSAVDIARYAIRNKIITP